MTTSRKNDRILQMYLPILPKHVWKDVKIDKVGDFVNKPPVVGTGPYQVVEWTNGQSARLVRNKSYWGPQGAADEIVFQFFPDAQNAMVDAFKNGELDYIRNPTGLQFDQLKTLPGRGRDQLRPAMDSPRSTSTATTRTSPTAAPRPRRSATPPSAPRSATRSIARP